MTIDLNCDMGEAYGIYKCGDDAGIMPLISVANVACGFHASDPSVMRQTVRLAKQHGVRVGAHPSYPDRDGFGRRRMEMEAEELTACIIYQVGALKGFLDAEGMALNHVKPHGAPYVDLEYNDDGEIVITRQHEPVSVEVAAAQALRSARDGQVQTMSGLLLDVKCETICVHSDTPGAVEIARAVKDVVVKYS